MGRKRKSDDDEEIRRKIKKLQDKLDKKLKRRRIISSSDSENEKSDESHVPSPAPSSAATLPSDLEPVASTSAATEPAPPAVDLAIDGPDTEELEAEILQLLGDEPKTELVLGPAVHKDIATRWQDILCKGLTKDVKEKLLKDYIAPSNCDLLLAPEINPETKAALPEALVKRDTSICSKQKQIGIALSALAVTMDRVLRKDTGQHIIKPLSDACRILCDSHFNETRTRRNFILGAVNSSMKETLMRTQRDKYLFGDNVTEKLKTAKIIQKSGDDLKIPSNPKSQFNKNNFIKKSNLNSQHRKSQPRGEARGPRGEFPRARPVTRSTRQQQSREPPPPQHRTRSPPHPRPAPLARR